MAKLPLITWSQDMSVGVPLLDRQHRQLFIEINLLDAANSGAKRTAAEDCLAALATYAVKHFNDEESYMRQTRYAAIEEHTRHHDEFNNQVREFRLRLADDRDGRQLAHEILNFLTTWLTDHIVNEDKAYARELFI